MLVCPCDVHKVSRLLTGKKGQLKKEVPSVAVMTNFRFGPNTDFFTLNGSKLTLYIHIFFKLPRYLLLIL